MFFRSILTILFLTLLALDLTIGLKLNDFCIEKQQECKGFYNENQSYHTKCELIKCHSKFNNSCGLNYCSRKKTECIQFHDLNSQMNILIQTKPITPTLFAKYSEIITEFNIFKNKFKDCENKLYQLNLNDFCLNGINCKKLTDYGFHQMTKRIDCKCPSKQSFKCGKYCTKDSIACDYYKTNEKNKHFNKINDCGNNHIFISRYLFKKW
jgi:hypothetical protein